LIDLRRQYEIRLIDYGLKHAPLGRGDFITTTGRTNLFYLPKYFRKGKEKRRKRTKEVMEKVI
jgi:hypothetical protein